MQQIYIYLELLEKNKNKLQSISPQIVQNISLKSFSDIPALQKTSGFFVQTGVPIVKTKLTVSQIFSVMNFVQSISSSFYIKIIWVNFLMILEL